MKAKVNYIDQVVKASLVGRANITDFIEFINDSVECGIKNNSFRLFLDLRDFEKVCTFTEEYELYCKLTQVTNLTSHHICALVYEFETQDIEFNKIVAKNWGQEVFKVFYDEKVALDWLEMSRKPSMKEF